MKIRYVIAAMMMSLLPACAGPRIPEGAAWTTVAPTPAGPVLKPCVLLHERMKQNKGDVVDGGKGETEMVFASVMVQHPRYGTIIIDPAVGREKLKDFGANPWIVRGALGDGSKATSLYDLLVGAGVSPDSVQWALVTHFHFDHVGGAPEIVNAKFVVSEADARFADHATAFGFAVIPHHEVDRLKGRLQVFNTDGPPFDGFPQSYDLFGDGSIVAVPTPGHTPGSVSWFVNSGDGNRWLFVGDAAWSQEGISQPAHKGYMGRLLDANPTLTGQSLAVLHAYQAARPNVHVLAAHDIAMVNTLPACGQPPVSIH